MHLVLGGVGGGLGQTGLGFASQLRLALAFPILLARLTLLFTLELHTSIR